MDFGGAGPVDITGATNFSAGTATTAFTLGSHPSTTVTMTLSATYTTTETCLRGSGGGGQMADIDAEARPAPDSGKSLPLTIEELMRRGPFWKVELGM
jgi:hypothetical protein